MTVSTRSAVPVGDRLRPDDRARGKALARLWETAEPAVVLDAGRDCPGRPNHPGRIHRPELGSTELWWPGVMRPNGCGEVVERRESRGHRPAPDRCGAGCVLRRPDMTGREGPHPLLADPDCAVRGPGPLPRVCGRSFPSLSAHHRDRPTARADRPQK